jgi:hypothetical protein
MQFIPLDNFKAALRASANATSLSFIDTSGTSRNFAGANTSAAATQKAKMPLFCNTSLNTDYSTPFASSALTIPTNTTTVPNVVGTTTFTYVNTSTGWTCTMTVQGSTTVDITHFVFVRKIATGSSTSYDAVLFALKLDTPVELNAENNYTANFTFSIEF